MNSTKMKFLAIANLAILAIFLLFLTACSGVGRVRNESKTVPLVKKPFSSEVSPDFEPRSFNSVAMYQLQANTNLKIPEAELERLSEILLEILEGRTSLAILNIEEKLKVDKAMTASKRLAVPLISQAQAYGQSLGAKYVLYGVLIKYDGPLSASTKPTQAAGAGFKLWLLDVRSGKAAWSSTYYKTQQALTDNILLASSALENGLRFKTRDKLFEDGFTSAALQLEQLKTGALKAR